MRTCGVVHTNGEANRYFKVGEAPEGWVKGGKRRGKTKHVSKVDWHSPETKQTIIDFLKKHNGSYTKVANEFGIHVPPLKKGIEKYFSDIDIFDYLPEKDRFFRSKDHCEAIYNKYNQSIDDVSVNIGSNKEYVRNTLERYGVGGYTIPVNKIPHDYMQYANLDHVEDDIIRKYLERYVDTPMKRFYVERYIKLVRVCHARNMSNPDDSKFYDRHHILPRSYFPYFADFKLFAWNCSVLTVREHYIAHVMLHYIMGQKMTEALQLLGNLSRYKKVTTSRLYEKIVTEYRKSESLKELARNRAKEMKHSVYYNDGVNHRRIKVGQKVPDGWVKGSLIVGAVGKKAIEDTDENKQKVIDILTESVGNLYDVADHYGVSEPSVRAFCKRNDIFFPKYYPNNKRYLHDKDYAMDVYNRHNGDWKVMSQEIGVQVSTIKAQYVKRWDIVL